MAMALLAWTRFLIDAKDYTFSFTISVEGTYDLNKLVKEISLPGAFLSIHHPDKVRLYFRRRGGNKIMDVLGSLSEIGEIAPEATILAINL